MPTRFAIHSIYLYTYLHIYISLTGRTTTQYFVICKTFGCFKPEALVEKPDKTCTSYKMEDQTVEKSHIHPEGEPGKMIVWILGSKVKLMRSLFIYIFLCM